MAATLFFALSSTMGPVTTTGHPLKIRALAFVEICRPLVTVILMTVTITLVLATNMRNMLVVGAIVLKGLDHQIITAIFAHITCICILDHAIITERTSEIGAYVLTV